MDRRSFLAVLTAFLVTPAVAKALSPEYESISPKQDDTPKYQVYTIEQLVQYGSIYPSGSYWDSVFEAAKVARQYCDSRKLEMHVLQVLPKLQAAPVDMRLLKLCDQYTIQTEDKTFILKKSKWSSTTTSI